MSALLEVPSKQREVLGVRIVRTRSMQNFAKNKPIINLINIGTLGYPLLHALSRLHQLVYRYSNFISTAACAK